VANSLHDERFSQSQFEPAKKFIFDSEKLENCSSSATDGRGLAMSEFIAAR
jgi:hypothetical protein